MLNLSRALSLRAPGRAGAMRRHLEQSVSPPHKTKAVHPGTKTRNKLFGTPCLKDSLGRAHSRKAEALKDERGT